MLFADGGMALIVLGLWIFCIIDVITTPDDSVRNLPKLAWLMIVIVLVDIGCIAWLVAGRNWNQRKTDLPYKGNRGFAGDRGESVRRTPARATNPDDDAEFLAGLQARAEEQRRRARETGGEQPGTAAGA